MTSMRLTVAAGIAGLFMMTSAFAQTAAPAAAPATPAPAAATPATPAMKAAPGGAMKGSQKPRTAQSIACSGKADQQGLHGKPRKAFMSKCKAGKA